jgi:hypothetical protein
MIRLPALPLCLAGLTLAVLALAGLPARAAAQDRRLAARLDGTTRAAVERVVDSALVEGLPTEPVIQKALEGASKGAPGPRIVAAVGTMAADLRRARSALGTGVTSDDLVAGSAALRAGATPSMLTDIQRADPRGGLAVPLAVFSDLVAGGLSVEAAWRSVADLARQGGDEQQFLDLRDRLRVPLEAP